MTLEVNLETNGNTIIAHAALTFRLNRFGEVGCRLTGSVMTDNQFSLTVSIAVVAGIHVVDGHLDRVAQVEVQTSGVVLSRSAIYIAVVQVEIVVAQVQLHITPFLPGAMEVNSPSATLKC